MIQGRKGAAAPAMPDLSGLAACVEDARAAAASAEAGPPDPARWAPLRAALARAGERLPPLYRSRALEPFQRTLDRIGEAGFRRILAMDPEVSNQALVLLDIAGALLAAGGAPATGAFQEVVSDLYDGFLSAEDRRGVKPPDRGVIPPLVKWGRPAYGPYTLPVDATAPFGLAMGIVSLPPANARRGLLAWAALGHETAGHDVLGADTGLSVELKQAVRGALRAGGAGPLADYWAARIGETASDVMGILNMGPAAGIALVGYFRALNAAWGSGPRLRSEGPATDPHPADVLRGWLAAATVRLLAFSGRGGWADAIEAETDRDAGSILLAGRSVTPALARRSAALVAEAVVRAPMRSLEGHALGAIQDWRDADEEIVARLRVALRGSASLPAQLQAGTYAAHAVAAAVVEALGRGGGAARLQERMGALLAAMHARNASWGPLPVEHPGDLAPRAVRWPAAPRPGGVPGARSGRRPRPPVRPGGRGS
jgi:hypothetical protein